MSRLLFFLCTWNISIDSTVTDLIFCAEFFFSLLLNQILSILLFLWINYWLFNSSAVFSSITFWLPYHLRLFSPNGFCLLLAEDISPWILATIPNTFLNYLLFIVLFFFSETCFSLTFHDAFIFFFSFFVVSISFSHFVQFSRFLFFSWFCLTFLHSKIETAESHYNLQHLVPPLFFLLLFLPTL